ncbi:Cyclin-dependent kinase A-2 [Hypsibius exemplaris]|uniref:cyclin-dependent kinase n=1 Tax=Hypsibius exemplaris TaxID=2072580 RepID=A0A1W0X4R3_HYPEX|nr:Cyclin-dependent kinase A-2 [Hypsibius exemplaris]
MSLSPSFSVSPPRRLSLAKFRESLRLGRTLEEQGYTKSELIAEGGYGKVHKGWDLRTNRPVALKYMDHQADKGLSQATIREVTLLRSAGEHRNIVQVLGCCFVPNATVLVLEYLDIDLSNFIKSQRHSERDLLTVTLVKSIMRDILSGADHLHSRGISHRDLKPRNVLVSLKTYEVKIADFGLSKFITFPVRRTSESFGTRWYRSPEVLLGHKTTTMRVDMWSIGTIFAEMKEKASLFPGRDHSDQIHLIFATLGTPTNESWPDIERNREFQAIGHPFYPESRLALKTPHMDTTEREILMMFLEYDPVRRISASDALRLPYFSSIHTAAFRGGLTNRSVNNWVNQPTSPNLPCASTRRA